MKSAASFIVLFLFAATVEAGEMCKKLESDLNREERAYESVIRVKVAGIEAHSIIARFIATGDALLEECPDQISLDRQYVLNRKLSKARKLQESYRVMTLEEVRSYAIRNPEIRVIYKAGTIRLLP